MGLPVRLFLYTPDQIATMLQLSEEILARDYLYFEGRSVGARRKDLMVARDISDGTRAPQWRVAEREFIRWLRVKGFRIYETGAVSN